MGNKEKLEKAKVNMDYKERLEKAKELYPAANADQRYVLECLFPELAESEDERIRKEMLNVFKQLDEGTTICGRNYDYAKWIAWLEKQGESYTKKDVDDAYLKGICDTKQELEKQVEQKPVIDIDIPFGAKDSKLIEASYYIPEGFHAEIEGNNVVIKQGEQNLANSAKTCKKSQRMISAEAKEALYDKPAWSEEDDVRLQACLDTLQAKSLMGVVDTNMTKWLKSLKQRIGG